jgi:hypothetical protein
MFAAQRLGPADRRGLRRALGVTLFDSVVEFGVVLEANGVLKDVSVVSFSDNTPGAPRHESMRPS